jgi:hypothetical protein
MSKAPAFQFYPSDWQRDMDDYPLEIEGAWIRICCRLYWSGGTATKTLKEWALILRKTLTKTEQILNFFEQKNVCNLVKQNRTVTITSRRIVRDEYIRKIRKEAGYKGGNPNIKHDKKNKDLVKQNDKQKSTPSSSSSFSSSIFLNTLEENIKINIKEESWEMFCEMRNKIKHPLTEKVANAIIRKLIKINKKTGQDMSDILERSAINDWRDVFPLQGDNGTGNYNKQIPDNNKPWMKILNEET